MRIGISTESMDYPLTGIGYYTYSLVKNILEFKKKHEFFLIHYKKNDNSLYKEANEVLVPLSFMRPREMLWHLFKLPKILKRYNLDMLHVTGHFGTFFQTRYKKIMTIHDLSAIKYPLTHKFYTSMANRFVMPKIARSTDGIVAVSENTKKDVVKYFKIPQDKIKVIYEAADESYKPVKNLKVLKEHNLNFPFVLYVGTLEARKNIPRLIKAFHLIKKKNIKHKLVIAGKTGWKFKDIFQLVKKYELQHDVVFTGYFPEKDMPALHSAASLLVNPSLYEGFGLQVLKSMQCGCPVVASNTSSLPEIVGDAGILINPLDINALADAIFNVLKNDSLRKELSKKGIKNARKFSWKKTAKETIDFYRIIQERGL